ncbi:MAG: hypothetical protein JWP13_604 [Candidatus Saccharibacteria bacterium]|nr:hypothetical protein [Candidatus Saccharibacteria bacterium]
MIPTGSFIGYNGRKLIGAHMSERIKSVFISKWAYLAYGLLAGALLILGIRYFTYHQDSTHYHANFAVYINGERENFKGPQYYEEVSICSAHDKLTPKARTHMHNEENGVVHVHDDGVTWGQFFENLGWYVGPDFIRTPAAMHTADGVNKLNIVLNGDNLTGLSTITNEVIGDKDRLLISYGDVDRQMLDKQFQTVPNDADEYNHKNDPSTCSGAHSATPADRLKHLF